MLAVQLSSFLSLHDREEAEQLQYWMLVCAALLCCLRGTFSRPHPADELLYVGCPAGSAT